MTSHCTIEKSAHSFAPIIKCARITAVWSQWQWNWNMLAQSLLWRTDENTPQWEVSRQVRWCSGLLCRGHGGQDSAGVGAHPRVVNDALERQTIGWAVAEQLGDQVPCTIGNDFGELQIHLQTVKQHVFRDYHMFSSRMYNRVPI